MYLLKSGDFFVVNSNKLSSEYPNAILFEKLKDAKAYLKTINRFKCMIIKDYGTDSEKTY